MFSIHTKRSVRIAAVGSVAAAMLAAIAPLRSQEQMLAKPIKAPDFAITTSTGRHMTLETVRGHVVLLEFWATWCMPCHMTVPTMVSLNQEFSNDKFTVVSVPVDDMTTMANVKPFVKDNGITYPVGMSMDENAADAQRYGADAIPSLVLIDKRGRVRWAFQGYNPGERHLIAAVIKHLLAEP